MARNVLTRLVSIGHLGMKYSRKGSGPRSAIYEVFGFQSNLYHEPRALPSKRVVRRLAKKYLHSSLFSYTPFENGKLGILIEIESGTSVERRSAFLGAVRANCKWQAI